MKEVQLKDICSKGSSTLKQKEVLESKGDYPVFGASGLTGYLPTYHQENEYIAIVKDGSGIGRVVFLPPKSSVIGTMQYILPKKGFDIRYVGYCLKSLDLSKYKQGAAIPHIYFRDYGERYVKVEESLSEQQAIVSRLDAAFAKIDALKANAEKQLNDARALFQAELSESMMPKEGWEEKKFGDVCWYNKINGLHKGTRYVGMEHIEQGTGLLLDTMSSDEVLSNTFSFKKGDVLYGRLRPYLKKVIVAGFDGCCSTEIFPIQSKFIVASFLMYWFLTDEITNKINATCSGCRMPRGNMNDVLKFDFSYPSIEEQQQIVAHLNALSAKVKELEKINEQTQKECDALKQAMLREIFE